MIFRLLLAYALISPIIGAFLMEQGWYGRSIGQYGYPNGVTWALISYTSFFLLSWWYTGRIREVRRFGITAAIEPASYRVAVGRSLFLLVPLTAFVLLGLGGVETIVGALEAGGFRASLGAGGALGYMIVKFFSPAILAYLVCLRWHEGRTALSAGMILVFVMVGLIALAFGYKTGLVLAAMPAAILRFWQAGWWTVIRLGLVAFAVVLIGFIYRWSEATDLAGLVDAIFYRAFVLHGDVPWKIWELWRNGYEFPSYLMTLPPVIGDRLFSLATGTTQADPQLWIDTHFGLLITNLSGYTPEYILRVGHSNVGNVFSEALIAGGMTAVVGFALLAGLVVRLNCQFIVNRFAARDYISASVAACYWTFFVMPWLIGGGITTLAHISVIVGTALTYTLLRYMAAYHVPNQRNASM